MAQTSILTDSAFANDETNGDPRPDKVPTTLRALIVLEKVAEAGVPVTPTEVNQSLKLTKATIHRIFASLEEEGFIQRDIDGRSYAPSTRLRNLAFGVVSSVRLRTARRAVLNALAEKLGETCNIALPDRDGMIYLDRVETKWPLRIQLPIGTKVPFHATASGKLYMSTLATSHRERLAQSLTQEAPLTDNTHRDAASLLTDLKRTRVRGYAEDNEEFMLGMVAVAVPILDQNKRLLSTLSVHAPSQRMTINHARDVVPLLKDAAEELRQLLLSS